MSEESTETEVENEDPDKAVPKKDGEPEKETPKSKTEDDKAKDDEFAGIKKNLDRAYAERDELKDKLTKIEKEKRDAEIARLNEEGKHKEAYEMQLKERDDTISGLKAEITSLTRDVAVEKVFRGYEFRNERASELAFDTVVKELVQNDKGEWVHRGGKTIKDFVKAFSEDPENAFLFKATVNRGTGVPPKTSSTTTDKSGSLFGRPQSEVLAMAAKGELPNQQR